MTVPEFVQQYVLPVLHRPKMYLGPIFSLETLAAFIDGMCFATNPMSGGIRYDRIHGEFLKYLQNVYGYNLTENVDNWPAVFRNVYRDMVDSDLARIAAKDFRECFSEERYGDGNI